MQPLIKAERASEPEILDISIEKLHFDPDNPRLPLKLRGGAESEVFTYLLRECSLVELMLSIGSQGFFQGEPLLVVPKEGTTDFVVVEGNRRLAAVKLLGRNDPPPILVRQVTAAREEATNKPEKVPVLKFKKRDDILVYLGYRHITGVNEWGALEKARYLQQLSQHFGDIPDKNKILAKQIGSRSDYVSQTLCALELVEVANDDGFFEKNSIDPDKISFSLLTTALSYTSIYEYVGLKSREGFEYHEIDREKLNELFTWIFKEEGGRTRLGESRQLKTLARVVKNDSALKSFKRGASLDEADLFTDGPLVLIRKLMAEAESRLSTALENLRHASGLNMQDLEKAQGLEKSARYLRSSIDSEVSKE
ncbi:ParB N-terminal domain-containing protein [Xanthomonas floridensis]|uniref:ParB N-terminal domain-containing protein n=1 Tax=Xanthomonas floridensis TaxID=1843580 RepID=A0ABU5Q3J1_9XANT|nr:ParB N-terminal domain-containing protein [Xanthomonas floridensis]MEA5126453.1 ParB N-terminal domain-containing protein [Xanthomonas floridensis]MEA5134426.1 ParB N-terminal domain-containing protein [Xanthomonas floridensis]